MVRRLLRRLVRGRPPRASSGAAPRAVAPPPPPPSPLSSKPAPPPPPPRPVAHHAPVGPGSGGREPVKLILDDGSVVGLPPHPALRRRVDYLVRNLLPERGPRPGAPGERVHVILGDGTSVPLAAHPGIEGRMVSYLAANILPPPP